MEEDADNEDILIYKHWGVPLTCVDFDSLIFLYLDRNELGSAGYEDFAPDEKGGEEGEMNDHESTFDGLWEELRNELPRMNSSYDEEEKSEATEEIMTKATYHFSRHKLRWRVR